MLSFPRASPHSPCAARNRGAAPPLRRMQFNQNGGVVEVQVFAKKLNTQRERVRVEIAGRHLKVEILDEACKEVEWSLDEELYQDVDPVQSKWDVWATQINVKMRKADGAIVWPALGKCDAQVCSRA